MTVDGTIHTDVQNSYGNDDADDGVSAFLSSFDDDTKKKVSTEGDEGATEGASTETETHAADTTEGEADDTEANKDPDPDDVEVDVPVNGEVKKATLRDLKRLYGQEAALTQKSQKVADAQRVAEVSEQRAQAALTAMLDRAQARHKPYADLDMLVLSQRMDTETFEALRKDAAAAEADVKFITSELDGHMKAAADKQSAAYRDAAVSSIKVLQDAASPHHIPDFGQPIYNDMMAFATKNGVPNAPAITSAPVLKLLHMAMLYEKAQAAAKVAAGKVKKVIETPQRVLKPGNAGDTKSGTLKSAIKAMRETGGDEDATTNAFMASFAE